MTSRDDLVESLLEGHELLVDTHLEAPLDVEGNIFALILIGDGNVLSVWLEVMVGPNVSCSTLKVMSNTPSISFSLRTREGRTKMRTTHI